MYKRQVVCGLLTITICAVSIGASTALAMNKMSRSATPYDLNVLSNVSVDGDSDIAAYLAAHDITTVSYTHLDVYKRQVRNCGVQILDGVQGMGFQIVHSPFDFLKVLDLSLIHI